MTITSSNGEKHYNVKPVGSMWGVLALLTIGLIVAILFGAPINPWWILAPLGIPLVLIVGLPIYAFLALLALVVIALGLIVVALVPVLLVCLLFGLQEITDELEE